jgi:hypothetical protein
MVDEVMDWNIVGKLLSDWSKQACINRKTSSRKARYYKRMHYLLGIPVIMFSSIVGSAAFTQIHQVGNNTVRVFAGVLSIVAAVLAGLQTFFGFGETAEKYRAVGIGYEKVENDIEEIQGLPVHLRGKIRELVDSLRERMDTLADSSPEIPRHGHHVDNMSRAELGY